MVSESLRAIARRLRGERAGDTRAVDRDLDAARDVVAPQVATLITELGLVVDAVASREHPGWTPLTTAVVMNATPRRLAWLQVVAPGVRLRGAITEADAVAALADADALIGWCTPAMLEAAPRLRWFQSSIAGADHLSRMPTLAAREVLVTNLRGVTAPVVAEHAVALLLGLTRALSATRQAPVTLAGRTALVAGLGGVGMRVARTAHSLGMRVRGIRASGGSAPPVEYVGGIADLAQCARDATVIINTLPLTPSTRGIFNAEFFSALEAPAYLVNVGRGGTVVTDDLVDALRRGRLAAAGLDVVEPEPLPRGHPLRALPNVLLTPHIAGSSDDAYALEWLVMRENLRRYTAGEALIGVVNLSRGY